MAQRLDRARIETRSPEKLRVLIEVHIAKEETKSGVESESYQSWRRESQGCPMLRLAGLMCIPPFTENAEAGEAVFQATERIARRVWRDRSGAQLPVLSMGMSHDFEVAIEEGATEVRVGTALFGTRGALGATKSG